jgi:flagellar biosynthesis protein FliR
MGSNISEVFDPQFGGQGSIIGNLYFMFTLVVFLLIDGHHAMLIGVRESLIQLPLLSVGMSANLFTLIVAMFHASTILAFQLAAPILVTMLIVDLCMGFVSKTVPQLNLMSAGLSVRGLVGFLVLIMGMGMSCDVIRHAMMNTMDTVMMAYRTHW